MLLLFVVISVLCGSLAARWAQAYGCRLHAGYAPDARTLWRSVLDIRQQSWAPLRDTGMALAAGLLAAWVMQDRPASGPAYVLLFLVLLCLAWIDARTGLLPDALTLPLMSASWVWGPMDPMHAMFAGVSVWLLLSAATYLYRRVRGRHGFGAGDIKCLAAMAGWAGIAQAMTILWLASLIGLLWWAVFPRFRRQAYPFGPCMALAALPVLLFDHALQLY